MKRRLAILLTIIVLLVGIIVIVAVVAANRVPNEAPIAGETASAFPQLEGTSLLIENIQIPDDLAGELRLLLVAYDTDQQIIVDKWLRPLELLNEQYPMLAGYYVPLLPSDTADAALAIIGGMTFAAPSDEDRARTIVVFTDVPAFNALTQIPDTSQVQLFLLDADGQIRWHGSGAYDPETLASLEATLAELTA